MTERSIYRATNLLYTQEKISRYRPGGYHPVCIDDNLKDSRYKICHKLGYGGFSTVWLARDKMLNRWVSIKVTITGSAKASRELQNIRSIMEHTKNKPGSQSISQLLDIFVHHGPNGAHCCLVFELLGPTLATVLQPYYKDNRHLRPETVFKISKQLLRAIALIHQVGYAHGDLSTSNVAFSSHKLSPTTEEEDLLEVTGDPYEEELVRVDGKPLGKGVPTQITETADWENWHDENDEDLRILDFGESFRQGAEPPELAQPTNLRVPEIIFTGRFDYRVDLWRAGLMIYALLFNAYPFVAMNGDHFLVAQMIDFVEKLPSHWHKKWVEMRKKAGKSAEIKSIEDPHFNSTLEQDFSTHLSDVRLKRLLPVIQGLMRFLPSDRISASKALELLN